MDITNKNFNIAVNLINNMKNRPSDDELLKLYGLYKQGSEGNNNLNKPGILDFKGLKKWDAWELNKGKSVEEAKKEYTIYAMDILNKYQ